MKLARLSQHLNPIGIDEGTSAGTLPGEIEAERFECHLDDDLFGVDLLESGDLCGQARDLVRADMAL
ncbi:hypothetical protein [Sphingomonas sp. IW22]|jgi:hypothetical protein|uniref:hypothetical protein n=1 Tax=Sphingomonas sp. IW22 TaxID=3242489 RepID=UPI003520FD9F